MKTAASLCLVILVVAVSINAQSGAKASHTPVPEELMKAPLTKLDGFTVTLEEYRGKVVLLSIWGIWCEPSRRDVPDLIDLQTKYRDSGLEVIGLNTGDKKRVPASLDDIRAYARSLDINYELLQPYDHVGVLNAFWGITQRKGGIPQTILIDRQGNLRGIFLGHSPAQQQYRRDMLEKVLNEPDLAASVGRVSPS